MASVIIAAIMPKPAAANAFAGADVGVDGMFASLVAEMTPAAQPKAVAASPDSRADNLALAQTSSKDLIPSGASKIAPKIPVKAQAPSAPPQFATHVSKPSAKTAAADQKPEAKNAARSKQDDAAVPANVPVAFAPAPAPKKAADDLVTAAGKRLVIDVAQLHATAANVSSKNAEPDAKSAAPEPTKDAAAQAVEQKSAAQKPADAALMQPHVKQAPQAQTTEAQTLTLRADSKDQSNAQSDSRGGQDHSRNQPQTAPQAASQPQHAQTAVAANAPAQATNTAHPADAMPAAVASVQPAHATSVAASLQVSAANNQSTPQPDLGAIAVSIAAKSHEGIKHFDIRLDPPEMGRIDVRLSVDDSGKAQAHLTADKPQTLDMLRRDSATLERSLKDAGLDLANNGLNFSLKGQQRQAETGAPARALSVKTIVAPDATPIIRSFAPGSATLDITV